MSPRREVVSLRLQCENSIPLILTGFSKQAQFVSLFCVLFARPMAMAHLGVFTLQDEGPYFPAILPPAGGLRSERARILLWLRFMSCA